MHLKYIVTCVVLLFVAIIVYVNINYNTETEVDSQSVNADLDVKEKHETVIYGASVVLPIPTIEPVQISAKKLELNKSSEYVKSEPECESFIKIGEKKTCLAQYSDKEESDIDYLADKSLEYKMDKITLQQQDNTPQDNTPLPVVIIDGDSPESEQVFEESHTLPSLN